MAYSSDAVKLESSPSPSSSIAPTFRFQLHSPPETASHPPSRAQTPGLALPAFRFGAGGSASASGAQPTPAMAWPAGTPAYTLPFADYELDHDDDDEEGSGPTGKDKVVRRRSSKACTFLGPSRKRGPPKGYIDAIEARLHQTEALIGILLTAAGVRAEPTGLVDASEEENGGARKEIDRMARSVLMDMAEDPLARAILTRIDQSAYGPGGRATLGTGFNGGGSGRGSPSGRARSTGPATPSLSSSGEISSTHPSHEWMDRVTSHVLLRARERHHSRPPSIRASGSVTPNGTLSPYRYAYPQSASSTNQRTNQLPAIITALGDYARPSYPASAGAAEPRGAFGPDPRSYPVSAGAAVSNEARPLTAPGSTERRQRRRIDETLYSPSRDPSPPDTESEAELDIDVGAERDESHRGRRRRSEEMAGLAGAVGQLSLNEDKQVRYHGKASGLHLLARRPAEREGSEDGRNIGGIWRFPKARVWPAAPEEWDTDSERDGDGLPSRTVQETLLGRYFSFVHPSFPVVHKISLLDSFSRGKVPPLLLLAMFSLAARHGPHPALSEDDAKMWPAGDSFLFRAKTLLDGSYASSRASTCQAMLLMGFREIGIGAMAQAWIYIGMAVRMAQDLGMHRDASGWARAGVKDSDGKLFSAAEISERRRIWYACVVLDKYVSTYIGRPLAIFERDFDTPLPDETVEAEESEEWKPQDPRPSYAISCFSASARLSNILGRVVESIYALKPASSRHSELVVLDAELDKWRISLPSHLQHVPGSRPAPLPHVLTLHMQYWCAVLLLHRPFIRKTGSRMPSPAPENTESRGRAERSYEQCASAANHITTIAGLYSETYTLKHCAAFLCYYIFTAAIMHVSSATLFPANPQARIGLGKCMDALREMQVVWPGAARALELLRGVQFEHDDHDMSGETVAPRHRKRSATQTLDDFRPFAAYTSAGHYALEHYPTSYAPNRWSASASASSGAYQSPSTAVMGPGYTVDETRQPRYQQSPQYWGATDYATYQPVYEDVYNHYNMYSQ
ncbi:unnamed protein product [Mycena citricolor]|uniref:Xylanolytic transcriptional activator regulatory domain-containing protein n=1 Tax=Mycena citricolor TaxID=2018698 RepID=A0AAD2HMV3_9AGAR|nr:unnamed protein product [Mycena citricolor]CAK5278883.1 unnamed protein product [Mycena citricolor]